MEEKRSNSFLLGTIGAIIGASIGAIPWILVYAFGNWLVVLLAVPIGIASFYGYKVTKAKIDKKLPIVIAISSLIVVTIATFVIVPMIQLDKEGYEASFENLQILYEYGAGAFVHDYIISLIFTALGIGGIVSNLHKQIKDGVDSEDIKLSGTSQNTVETNPVIHHNNN